MALSPALAQFIGVMFSSICFGFYSAILVLVIVQRPKVASLRRMVILVVLTALWLLTGLAFVCHAIDLYIASFVVEGDAKVNYFLEDKERKWPLIAQVAMGLSTTIADSFLCWRLFVIWGGSKRVMIAPIAFLISTATLGFVTVVYNALGVMTRSTKYYQMKEIWGLVTFTLSAVTTILVTFLICWKVWRVTVVSIPGASARQGRNRLYVTFVTSSIEGGLVYTVTVLVFVIIRPIGQVPVSCIIFQILQTVVGMTPTVIILRLQLLQSGTLLDTAPTSGTLPQFSPPTAISDAWDSEPTGTSLVGRVRLTSGGDDAPRRSIVVDAKALEHV